MYPTQKNNRPVARRRSSQSDCILELLDPRSGRVVQTVSLAEVSENGARFVEAGGVLYPENQAPWGVKSLCFAIGMDSKGLFLQDEFGSGKITCDGVVVEELDITNGLVVKLDGYPVRFVLPEASGVTQVFSGSAEVQSLGGKTQVFTPKKRY